MIYAIMPAGSSYAVGWHINSLNQKLPQRMGIHSHFAYHPFLLG